MLDTGGKEGIFENQNHSSVIFMCRGVGQHLLEYTLVPRVLWKNSKCSLSHFSSPKWVWWDTLETQPVEKQKICTFPPGKPFRSCFLNLFPLHVGSQSFRSGTGYISQVYKGTYWVFLAGSLKSSLIIQSLPPKCWDDRENQGTEQVILVYTASSRVAKAIQ